MRTRTSTNVFSNTEDVALQNRILITYCDLTRSQESIVNLDVIRNHTFIVTKQDFNISLMVFLKHVQQNAVPQLFLELCQGKYQSNIPTFKNMILFLDAHNILRTFSLSSHQCSQINYNYLMSHLDEAKYFVPTPKDNRIFAIKLCMYYHIKHKCAGVTYLSQSFSQYFHVQNMRTICSLAFNLCHVCLL